MGKKAKQKQQRKNGQQLNMVCYTEESYFECYPTATEENYMRYILNDDQKMVVTMEKENNISINSIRKIVIDEEYFDWLEENDLECNSETRIAYANSRTNEEVIRLWEENDMVHTAIPAYIPFLIHGGETVLPVHNTPISKEEQMHFKRLLSNSIGVDVNQIFIHSELLRADLCTEEFQEEVLEPTAIEFFEGDRNIQSPTVPFIAKQTNQTLIFRFLPVVIHDIDKPIVTRKEFDAEEWVDKSLPEVALTRWAEDVYKKSDDINISVMPYFVPQEGVQNLVEEFMATLEENARANGAKIMRAK